MSRTLIVGGAGAVGSWVAQLLQSTGSHISILDRVDRLPRLEASVPFIANYIVGDVTEPDSRVQQLLTEIDLLVLAVPAEVALAVLDVIPGMLRTNCLLVDTLSSKAGFSDALRKSMSSSPAVGLNPFFRPSASKVHGSVAWVPYTEGADVTQLVQRLTEQGLQMLRMTPLEHDEAMAAVQTLVHILVLAFGTTLLRSNFKLAALIETLPPPFRCLSALLARIVSGEPHVYWEIQKDNPFSKTARAGLSEALSEWDRLIEAGDFDGYKSLFAQLGCSGTIDIATSERMGQELFDALDRVATESRDVSAGAWRNRSQLGLIEDRTSTTGLGRTANRGRNGDDLGD